MEDRIRSLEERVSNLEGLSNTRVADKVPGAARAPFCVVDSDLRYGDHFYSEDYLYQKPSGIDFEATAKNLREWIMNTEEKEIVHTFVKHSSIEAIDRLEHCLFEARRKLNKESE